MTQQPKDISMAVITLETKTCYREHKFPEGHAERACHLGLDAIDLRVCRHCTWLSNRDEKKAGALSGPHLARLVGFLKELQTEAAAAVPAET